MEDDGCYNDGVCPHSSLPLVEDDGCYNDGVCPHSSLPLVEDDGCYNDGVCPHSSLPLVEDDGCYNDGVCPHSSLPLVEDDGCYNDGVCPHSSLPLVEGDGCYNDGICPHRSRPPPHVGVEVRGRAVAVRLHPVHRPPGHHHQAHQRRLRLLPDVWHAGRRDGHPQVRTGAPSPRVHQPSGTICHFEQMFLFLWLLV